MRIIKAVGNIIALGKQGENEATQVQFEVEPWIAELGDGRFQLLHQRATDEDPHAVVVSYESGIVFWDVANTELAIPGYGRCELQFYQGDMVAKSQIWVTQTVESLSDVGDKPPDPWESWVEDVLTAASSAEESADAAENSATAAAQSATAAATSESNAGASATAATTSEANAKTAAQTATDKASAADESAVAAAQSATAASTSADRAATSATSAGESATAAATSATNAGESATAAATSAEESTAAKTDIQDSVDGVAQEDTAQSALEQITEIVELLHTIVDKGSGLNGFTLALGENSEVILSYTDPSDSTITDAITMPTLDTSAAIADTMADIATSLAKLAGKETTET